ncbi:hypothetical protein B0H16DRAFT_1463201 [Mycena metata]|uniref:Uncharacterized protein n=1 Tax=Mycena metata TaxID=1033252 RepID=A0AAD7IJ26_9AGAR|nr:hypothetical protein B0H16DRAFT_1463201 [Mycena metata]
MPKPRQNGIIRGFSADDRKFRSCNAGFFPSLDFEGIGRYEVNKRGGKEYYLVTTKKNVGGCDAGQASLKGPSSITVCQGLVKTAENIYLWCSMQHNHHHAERRSERLEVLPQSGPVAPWSLTTYIRGAQFHPWIPPAERLPLPANIAQVKHLTLPEAGPCKSAREHVKPSGKVQVDALNAGVGFRKAAAESRPVYTLPFGSTYRIFPSAIFEYFRVPCFDCFALICCYRRSTEYISFLCKWTCRVKALTAIQSRENSPPPNPASNASEDKALKRGTSIFTPYTYIFYLHHYTEALKYHGEPVTPQLEQWLAHYKTPRRAALYARLAARKHVVDNLVEPRETPPPSTSASSTRRARLYARVAVRKKRMDDLLELRARAVANSLRRPGIPPTCHPAVERERIAREK